MDRSVFFYPQRGTLGYTDAFFLLGFVHAMLRILGADMFTAYMVVMAALATVGFSPSIASQCAI